MMTPPSGSFFKAAFGIVVAAFLAAPGKAAVVFPGPERMTWDFTLDRINVSSGAMDQIALQFGTDPIHPDNLDAGESLLVEIFASGQSVPVLSTTIGGHEKGLGAFFWVGLKLDDAFPTLSGTAQLSMLSGTVEIERMIIIMDSPSGRYVTSLQGPYQLVPEPSACFLTVTSLSLLLVRRKRPAGGTHLN